LPVHFFLIPWTKNLLRIYAAVSAAEVLTKVK
jgi:hypothetical protein